MTKLARPQKRPDAGLWMTADKRFFVYRPGHSSKRKRFWLLLPTAFSATLMADLELLRTHGIDHQTTRFQTRRAALQALQQVAYL